MARPSSPAFVNQVLACTLAAIGFGGSIGLGTVWMRHQISVAANANRVLEARVAEVERRCLEAEAAIAAEQDPDVLLRRDAAWGLGLAPPRDDHVLRVTEDPALRLAAKRNRGLFDENPSAPSEAPPAVSFRVAAQP